MIVREVNHPVDKRPKPGEQELKIALPQSSINKLARDAGGSEGTADIKRVKSLAGLFKNA